MTFLHAAALMVGFGLLIFVIYKIGFQTVVETISRIGWGILIIIALNFSRHMLRALSMYLAIPAEHRTFRYSFVLNARLGGEAVSVLSFTGPVLGDLAKAALLKKRLPLAQGAAALIVDNILYYVSVMLLVLGGIATLLFTYGSSGRALNYALAGVTAFAIVVCTGLALTIKFHATPFSWFLKILSRSRFLPKAIASRKERIREVESSVFQLYNQRRAAFFGLFGISISAHLLSVVEVFIALKMLGFSATVSTAFIIESLTKVINFVFGFIPGAIGIYEGGNGVILSTMGYAVATGVALALVRRGGIVFSTFVGMGILLWRTLDRSKQRLSATVLREPELAGVDSTAE